MTQRDADAEGWPSGIPYVTAEVANWPEPERSAGVSVAFVLAIVGWWVFLDLVVQTSRAMWWAAVATIGVVVVCVVAASMARHAARRRIVGPLRAAQQPLWEADWTGPRDVLTAAGELRRPLPLGIWLAFPVLAAATIATHALRDGAWTRALAVGGPLVAASVVYAALVHFRGRVVVRLGEFPQTTGARATYWIANSPGGARIGDAQAMLRCVESVPRGRARFPVQRWSHVVALHPSASPGPDEFVEVSFDVPADAPGTALHGDPPVRWELLVAGRTRWGRVMQRVVVPVYAGAPE